MQGKPATSARRAPQPACAIPMAAPMADAAIRSALIATAAWLGARTLAIEIPKIGLPKIELPKLPDLPKISLPGGKKDPAKDAPKAKAAPRPKAVNVTVRAANIGVANPDAPTLAELTGEQSQATIAAGEGWKRFPSRRMPGANMEGWKEIAKEISPDL